jgi:hypothetical protein
MVAMKRLQPIPFEAQEAQSEWLLEQFDKIPMSRFSYDRREDGFVFDVEMVRYSPEQGASTSARRSAWELFNAEYDGLGCLTSMSSEPIEWKFYEDFDWDKSFPLTFYPSMEVRRPIPHELREFKFPYANEDSFLKTIRSGEVSPSDSSMFQAIDVKGKYNELRDTIDFEAFYKGKILRYSMSSATVDHNTRWVIGQVIKYFTQLCKAIDNE